MKRIGLLFVLAVFLTGCSEGSRELERGMALRDTLLSSPCSFDVDITADYGEKIHTFSLSCSADTQGNLTFTVTQPESISGITGKISGEGGALTFGETALQFDLLADGQLTPVSSPWIMLSALRGGYLTCACKEEELVRLSVDDSYEEDALHLDIWLDQEDKPVRGEIIYDDRRILTLSVKNFAFQ